MQNFRQLLLPVLWGFSKKIKTRILLSSCRIQVNMFPVLGNGLINLLKIFPGARADNVRVYLTNIYQHRFKTQHEKFVVL